MDSEAKISIDQLNKMQVTRLQLNSRDNTIDVYKSLPSAELKKRYVIRVEQLTIPAMNDGLILNNELFNIERRCVLNRQHTIDGVIQGMAQLPLITLLTGSEFIPQNVKTVSQLVYQMNAFFRKYMVKLVTTTRDFEDGADWHDIPDEFKEQEESDWYDVQNTIVGKSVGAAIEAIYRSDGKIGFKFTPSGQQLFVLRLTDEGKRIFGWPHRYIAVDSDSEFTPYLNGAGVVISSIPALTESIVCVTRNSIFNHGHYRHEIAILSSLPLQQYIECDQNRAQFKQQLASYRFPGNRPQIEYQGTLFKILRESRKNVYVFEHANRTHNEFLLTGTDLQNFHIRLMARNYEWSKSKELFVIDEKAYPLPADSLWTLTLKVTPLE